MHYMADCELHRAGAARLTPDPTIPYPRPPAFRSLPLAQWFQTAHTTEILGHVDEMKAVVHHRDRQLTGDDYWRFSLYEPTAEHVLSVAFESDSPAEVKLRELIP